MQENDLLKLTKNILKSFPIFFGDYTNWEYYNGKDAGKDFLKIYDLAKKIHNQIQVKNSQ